MQIPASATCQCGQVRLQLNSEPLFVYACHCTSCQKRTGSAFSMGIMALDETVDIRGELSSWERTADTGQVNTRYSCSECGNIIYGVGTLAPRVLKLQAGLLDDTRDLEPEVHIWTRSAQAWVILPKGVPKFSRQPEDPLALLSAAADYRQQRGST